MITELEQEFFKVFGIEPIPLELYGNWLIKGTIKNGMVYPEITDRKLLEMICIYAQREVFCFPVVPSNEETWTVSLIKENIIKQLMYLGKYSDDKEIVKHQIQQLFKGEE